MTDHSVEHMLACVLEAMVYDAGEAESVCISITRNTRDLGVRLDNVARSVRGASRASLREAVRALYDEVVERAHKDRVRAQGLLTRLDASPSGGTDG